MTAEVSARAIGLAHQPRQRAPHVLFTRLWQIDPLHGIAFLREQRLGHDGVEVHMQVQAKHAAPLRDG